MEFIFYVLLVLAGILFLTWRKKARGKSMPGPKGLPILGNLFQMKEPLFNTFYSMAKTYGPIFELNVLNEKIIVLNDQALIRKLLTTEPYADITVGRKKTFYGETFLHGSQSVAFMDGGKTQQKYRKSYNRGLHVYGEGIPAFENLILTQSTQLRKQLSDLKEKDFDFKEQILISLTNLLFTLLSGSPMEENDPDSGILFQYDQALNVMLHAKVDAVLNNVPLMKYVPGKMRDAYLSAADAKARIKRRFVDKMKATYTPGVIRGLLDTFIQQQLEEIQNGKEVIFTDERIVSTCLETAAAGILTTFSTLSSMMLCLAHNPDVQVKVQDEIDAVIGQDRLPELKDRNKMPYTEAVIMETLRLVPVVPLSLPRVCKSDMNFEGSVFEKDTVVISNTWFVQHDERVWGDPWVFRPERFMTEDGTLIPYGHELRKSWMPFSIGRRNCIGESFGRSRVFLYLTSLLQTFTFAPPTGENLASYDPRTYLDGITIIPDSYKIRAVHRKL